MENYMNTTISITHTVEYIQFINWLKLKKDTDHCFLYTPKENNGSWALLDIGLNDNTRLKIIAKDLTTTQYNDLYNKHGFQ